MEKSRIVGVVPTWELLRIPHESYLSENLHEGLIKQARQLQTCLNDFQSLLLRKVGEYLLTDAFLGHLPVRHFDHLIKFVSKAYGRNLGKLTEGAQDLRSASQRLPVGNVEENEEAIVVLYLLGDFWSSYVVDLIEFDLSLHGVEPNAKDAALLLTPGTFAFHVLLDACLASAFFAEDADLDDFFDSGRLADDQVFDDVDLLGLSHRLLLLSWLSRIGAGASVLACGCLV